MTQEEKYLLFRDLSARLPYGVKLFNPNSDAPFELLSIKKKNYDSYKKNGVELAVNGKYTEVVINNGYILCEFIKPYLRPMSSMTEEEKQEILRAWNIKASFVGSMRDAIVSDNTWWGGKDKSEPLGFDSVPFKYMSAVIDWLDKNMFDYRGLIPMDLAIEAPKGMYKIK